MVWLGNYQDAVGQALADTQAVLAGGTTLWDPIALSVRLGDLSRSNSLLSLEANLKTLEQYSRLIHIGQRSTRALTLATLATDILSGYLMLERRARLWGTPHTASRLGGEQDGGGTASTTTVGRQLGKSVGHIPTDLILVGRALGLLDGITRQLDPQVNAI